MPEFKVDLLIVNPHHITKRLMLGEADVIFRLLLPSDAGLLGRYFEGLSDETRQRFGPHPLTMDEAQRLCDELNYRETLRFVAFLPGTAPQIVGYFILILGVTEHETDRYARYGITLDSTLDCTFAPSVADEHQGSGLGSLMMPQIIDVTRKLGRRAIVLLGGTQATNERAVHFYEKFGFGRVGKFQTEVENHDMIMYLE